MRSEWRSTTLGEIAVWSSGGTPKAGTATFYGGDVKWATISDLNGRTLSETAQTLTELGLRQFRGRLLPVGTVLFSMYGSVGKTAIVGAPMTTNQAIAAGTARDEVLPGFLHLLAQFVAPALASRARGAVQQNINRGMLEGAAVRLPPMSEQRRITDLVAAADSRASALESLVVARRAARWALLATLLEGHLPERRRLADVADIQLGKTINPRQAHLDPKYDYLRAANVLDGHVSVANLKQMHFTADDLHKYQVRANDVLVLEGGDAGRTALYTGEPVPYQNHIHRLRAIATESLPQFLALAVEYAWRAGQLDALCSQTTIKHLPVGKLREFEIVCPPLTDQQRLIDVLAVAEEALRKDEAALAATRAARQQLLHDLLSGDHRIPDSYDEVLG